MIARRIVCTGLALWLASTPIVGTSMAQPSTAAPQAPEKEPETEQPAGVIDIIVTDPPDGYETDEATSSTRTPTPLQETPQSVSVVTRKLIDDQQVNTVSDAVTNVSSVVPTDALLTPAFDNTLIRGFPAEQMIDGFTQYYNPGDRQSLVNVQRIEVLKGPNGVLYGGGAGSTVGGLINLISKEPRAAAFRTVGTRAGSYGLVQPFVDLNQPIGEYVRVRFTGEYTNTGSEIDVLQNERFNLNPAVTVTDNDTTSLTLRGKVSRWRQPDYQGLPATGTVVDSDAEINPIIKKFVKIPDLPGNPKVDRDLFIGNPDIQDSTSEFDSASAFLRHTFDEHWSANLQARYARSQFEENAQLIGGAGLDFGADRPVVEPPALSVAFGLGALPFSFFNARLFQEQKEISVVGNAIAEYSWGPTQSTLLFGADYSQYDDSGFINFLPVEDQFLIDVAEPVFDQPFVAPGPGESDNFVSNTVSGGYVQVQTTLYDRLHLLGGVRLGQVKIDYQGPDSEDLTDTVRWIPRVGAVLDLVGGISAFAGYSDGMRGQPFAIFTETPLPELASQFEAGLKASVGEWLQGQIAYFDIQRENVTVPDPDGGLGSVPRGRQASHGIDVEFILHPIAPLSIVGAYGWTRASFEDDLFASFGSGLTAIPGVPENSGRLWLNYDFEGWLQGLRIGGGVYAQSETQISRRNPFYSDAFFTVDATVGYEFDFLTLGFRMANLTNEEYFVRLNYLGARVAPGPARSWQLTAAVRF